MAEPAFGNHEPGWEPTSADVPTSAAGLVDVEEIGRVESKRQSQADMTAAFGPPIEEPDGKVRWSIDMRDPRNRGLYKELSDPHRRALRERNQRWNQTNRKVVMRNRQTGEERLVFEEVEDQVGRKSGFVRSTMACGARVERGPDGMLFRLVGDWMPTGRTCLGTPLSGDGIARGVQRDPDGGYWINVEGEWLSVSANTEEPEGKAG